MSMINFYDFNQQKTRTIITNRSLETLSIHVNRKLNISKPTILSREKHNLE